MASTTKPKKSFALEVDQVADINTRYVYQLVKENDRRGRVYNEHGEPVAEKKFRPLVNVLLRSSILWDGRDCVYDDNGNYVSGRKPGRYLIEYYDGCSSLFSDTHPKETAQIDLLRKSTREVRLIEGFVTVYGYDKMLKEYLDICSWNAESEFRVPTVEAIFTPVNNEIIAAKETVNIDLVEEAMDLAKKATEKKMRTHAIYLGLEDIDQRTQSPKSEKVLRAEYRKEAMNRPAIFVKTFNDKSIEVSNWVEMALNSGEISTTLFPNKAVWRDRGAEICDISGLKSRENIQNKLVEFAKTPEGADFNEQLTAIYN